MRKIISVLLCIILVVGLFSGCKKKEVSEARIIMSGDMNAATAVYLMEAAEKGETKVPYTFETVYTSARLIAAMGSNEADIAILPASLATIIYNKTRGAVQVYANVSEGDFSIIENGDTIKKLSDLKGKEIYIAESNNPTAFMLKYILKKNGLDPEKDVTIEYLKDDNELEEKLIDGSVKLAVATQPVKATVLSKNSALRSVMNLKSEWDFITDNSGFVSGCVVISKDFAKKNKDTVKKFLEEYEASVDEVASKTGEAAELCVKHGIMETVDIASSAIKASEIKYVDGKNMKTDFKAHISALHSVGMRALGQKAPGDTFYYGA